MLLPAARYLPRAWALGLAEAIGGVLTPFSAGVRVSFRDSFAGAGDAVAREWLTRPYRDFVIAARFAAHLEDPAAWTVESRNEPAIVRAPGQSLVLATGHFSREAMSPLYLQRVLPKDLTTVIVSTQNAGFDPKHLRVRVQLGQMIGGIKVARRGDVDIGEVGAGNIVIKLLRQLRQPNRIVMIAADAVWPSDRSGAFERAFAGHGSRSFALGAARLARLSRTPIVACVPVLIGDRHVVLEWSDPIYPSDDADFDVRATNAILDAFERAVGRRPGQYVVPIGHDRQWDAVSETWGGPAAANDTLTQTPEPRSRARRQDNA